MILSFRDGFLAGVMLVVDFREDTLLQTKISQQPMHFRVGNFPFAVWWDMLVVVEDTPSKTNRWIPKIMVWKRWLLKYGRFGYLC